MSKADSKANVLNLVNNNILTIAIAVVVGHTAATTATTAERPAE